MELVGVCQYHAETFELKRILETWVVLYYLQVKPPACRLILLFLSHGTTVPSGLLIIEASQLYSDNDNRQDSSGKSISPMKRSLPNNTQHSQETDIHAHGVIRTHNPRKRAATVRRLRPSAH
jgi:hypothetical protein